MSALRPQRALFPNSGLGRPLSEKVRFVVIANKLDLMRQMMASGSLGLAWRKFIPSVRSIASVFLADPRAVFLHF